MLDEGVEDLVVEGLVPGLSREHFSEVCAVLAYAWLEADRGGALGCRSHELGCGREPDDVRPVVSEHRLVLRDVQFQLWVGELNSHHYVYHLSAIVVIGDGRQELVERLDCPGFTLGCQCAASLV